jgi:hypothetical protein
MVIDCNAASGISDVGKEDEESPGKIKACNIPVIAAPVLYGALPFTEIVIERHDRTHMEGHAKIEQHSPGRRLQDSLLRELEAKYTIYSTWNTIRYMLQSGLSSLFKKNLIYINLKDLLRRQRRQVNEIGQLECHDFLQEFPNTFTETLLLRHFY